MTRKCPCSIVTNTPAPGRCYNFWRVKKTCYTILEFPGPVDSENVFAEKNNFHPGAPEAKMCPKNHQNLFGRKFRNFCFWKVVGNQILSGKYVKSISISLSVEKLRPIENLLKILVCLAMLKYWKKINRS